MEISSIVDLVVGARELVNSANPNRKSNAPKNELREIREIIEALRLVYFAPKGVVFLLNELAKGVKPSRAQIEAILTSFNDAEPFVMRSLLRMDLPHNYKQETLSLKAKNVLREISYGKGGVREKVKFLLNESLTYDQPVSKQDAQNLVQEIVALNSAIEDAEEALMMALRN